MTLRVEMCMGNRTPTTEQQAIIDAALGGGNVVIQAGAGTGKTSTLEMLAEALPDKKILYIVYNRAMKDEAKAKFGSNVTVKTGHGLAYGPIVMGRNLRGRINAKFQKVTEVANILDAPRVRINKDLTLTSARVASIAKATVLRFCYSADTEITGYHVPFQNNITGDNHETLKSAVLPIARAFWADITSGPAGRIKMEHDHYLKMFALTNPTLKYDVVLLDEAQDSNPCIANLVRNQKAQQIVVGDRCQQMYSWRGAVDALATWPNAIQLYLTQSWRFGQAIADEANLELAQIDTPMRLTGNPGIESVVGKIEAGTEDAVLCRTNGGAMGSVINLIKMDKKVALVGGGTKLADLATAATDLMAGRKTSHPELYAFADWNEVRTYVDTEESAGDLKTMVRLIDTHGAAKIIKTAKMLVDEEVADVTVSTAHKCSPPDEPILTTAGWKPIGDLTESDRLASYVRRNNRLTWGKVTDRGFAVEKFIRHHKGNLVVLESEVSRTRVTPEHHVLIAFAPPFWDRWAVYLMRRGDWWRVGMCRTGNRPYRSGDLGSRLSAERASEGWILSLHDTREAAATEEARVQAVFGLTGLMFERRRGLLSREAMHAIHKEASVESQKRARAILDAFGLIEGDPLYRNLPGARQQGMFQTAAANVPALSGCVYIPCAPREFHDHDVHHRGGWSPERVIATVTKEAYDGPVYGLEVLPHHFYVSGNAVVHNSKGREWNRVRLAGDFFVPAEGEVLPPAEIMISYVAVTRAKLVLDRGGN